MNFSTLLDFDKNLLISAQSIVPEKYAFFLIFFGESIVLWVVLLLIGMWLYGAHKKNSEIKIRALHIFGLIAAVFIIYSIINFGVPQWREHPFAFLEGKNISPLIPHPTDNSFPSGHALFSTAAVFAVIFYSKNSWIIFLTILLGILTVCSRVLGGVHYPGDILGGIFFGIIGVLLFKNIAHKIIKKVAPFLLKIASYLKL